MSMHMLAFSNPERSVMRKPLLLVLLILVTIAPLGCDGPNKSGGSNSAATTRPTVPAPPGLLADIVFATPRLSWTDLRGAVGGPAILLPRSLGGLVVNLVGFPLRAVQEVDEQLPIVGAAVLPGAPPDGGGVDSASALIAFGVHVKDGARLLRVLTMGPDARFTSKRDQASRVVWLERKTEQAKGRVKEATVAVLENYLLIANSAEAVRQAGPYLAYNLSRRKAPSEDLVVELTAAATRVTLGRWLSRWSSRLSGGADLLLDKMAPLLDLQDASKTVQALLNDIGRARFAVSLLPTTIRLVARLEPRNDEAKKRFAALSTVAPAQLLKLPDDTLVAARWTETAAGRRRRAEARGKALEQALAVESTALKKALLGVAESRGDRTLVAVRCSGVGVTGFASGQVEKGARLRESLNELIALRKQPAVAAKLKKRGLKVSTRKGRLERITHDIVLVRIEQLEKPKPEKKDKPKKKDKPSEPPAKSSDDKKPKPSTNKPAKPTEPIGPIDLRYAIGAKRFYLAAGLDTVGTLQHLVMASPGVDRTLSMKSTVKASLEWLGDKAWVVIFVDPQAMVACRAGAPGGKLSTPVTLALGPEADGGVRLRFELAKLLLKVAAKELLSF